MQRQTLGFIGLGRMGAPMVRRLTEAGHHVVVHDTRPDAARELPAEHTTFAASPKAVGDEAGIVFCSLPTPPIVKEVVLGANGIAAGSKVKTIVDVS
ncbi:NAD(P)-binding domain-containing protein, partial [Mesorhizobium sp. M7A.F.Ca.CA.001.08.1.1]